MGSSNNVGAVTQVLAELHRGQAGAQEQLFELIYAELRGLAAARMRIQPAGHTLQPTDLVHEAYLKLMRGAGNGWEDRAHFLRAASRAMRSILVDHARSRDAQKRGGGIRPVTLHEEYLDQLDPVREVLAVHEALTRLAQVNSQQAQVVEMRYFCGLTLEETSRVLGLGLTTVHRTWEHARLWLAREIGT